MRIFLKHEDLKKREVERSCWGIGVAACEEMRASVSEVRDHIDNGVLSHSISWHALV